ncbi:MAG: hypothetical protein NVSMB25_19190 [Thermoleophilaceae bacterium]
MSIPTAPTDAPPDSPNPRPALTTPGGHPPRSLSGQVLRFLLVGVTNTAVSLVVFAVANRLGVWYPVASAVAFAVGALNGYTLNRVWTFRAGAFSRSRFARYAVVQLVGLGVNELAIIVAVDALGTEHVLAQVFALVMVSAMTFALNRQWAFATTAPA